MGPNVAIAGLVRVIAMGLAIGRVAELLAAFGDGSHLQHAASPLNSMGQTFIQFTGGEGIRHPDLRPKNDKTALTAGMGIYQLFLVEIVIGIVDAANPGSRLIITVGTDPGQRPVRS